MQPPLGLRLEIVFQGTAAAPQTSLDLLERLAGTWPVLVKESFELGQQNPHAKQLFVEGENDALEVSEEIVGVQSFESIFEESLDCTEMLLEEISKLLVRQRALEDNRQASVPVDPVSGFKDLAFRVAELERSLAREKAWTDVVERQNAQLKEQLLKLQKSAHKPLSEAIAEAMVADMASSDASDKSS